LLGLDIIVDAVLFGSRTPMKDIKVTTRLRQDLHSRRVNQWQVIDQGDDLPVFSRREQGIPPSRSEPRDSVAQPPHG